MDRKAEMGIWKSENGFRSPGRVFGFLAFQLPGLPASQPSSLQAFNALIYQLSTMNYELFHLTPET